MSLSSPAIKPDSKWHRDWQDQGHVQLFDARSGLSDRALVGNYEMFSDVLLLGGLLARNPAARVVEIGCATGEFYRYLKLCHPGVTYDGTDISRPAVAKAREKYPQGRFHVSQPQGSLQEQLTLLGLPSRPELIYSKDVLHHQTDPYGFLDEMLQVPTQGLVLRTRTRDRGETVLDPEVSCQYHYQGWMPYIVFNLEEIIGRIRGRLPDCEIAVRRNRMVLGGRENRFLPKDCYLPETGTAETALGIFLKTDHPGRVEVVDRQETAPRPPLLNRVVRRLAGRP